MTYDPIRASDAAIARLKARHPMLIDLGTARIERLLATVGSPQDRLPPVIHVAGTNGKGSVCAYLRAMAEKAGPKAHVLTSPHLVRFAERIRVAGTLIEDEALADVIDELEAANGDEPISFFELTTAAAFLAFARTPADLAIIEVGLGGRFDATNVFKRPATTVITPVDYDHVEMLGPTLGKIAWEKAGIMRRGVPCVVARQPDEAMAAIEAEADKLGVPLTVMGRDIDAHEQRGRLIVQLEDELLDLPPPSLLGVHQIANAGLAVAAARKSGLALDPDGVAHADWPARFQKIAAGMLHDIVCTKNAALWLDGGHNPHAGKALAETCERLLARDARPLVLVTAMLQRKNAAGFLAPFAERLKPSVIAPGFDTEGAHPPSAIVQAARSLGLIAEIAPDLTEAVRRACEDGPANILICGGLHFAGEALALSPETWPS